MPAVTPEAILRKYNNRKSSKDLGREAKIESLGGKVIKIVYGEPLEDTLRKERLEYLYDLMYPKRHRTKAGKRVVLTEGERTLRDRESKRRSYYRKKEKVARGERKYTSQTPYGKLHMGAKVRAKKQGVPFTLEVVDVKKMVEETIHCPVLGMELCWTNSKLSDNSPTLDKFEPSLGYTKENTTLISNRANKIKTNATTEEVGKVYLWMRSIRG